MCFKDIYEKVEELKEYDLNELLENLDIRLFIANDIDEEALYINYLEHPTILIRSKKIKECVMFHEIGHYLFDRKTHLANKRTNENNANIFMCLMLLKNEIWEYDYFDTYLINQGVQPKVARTFNDSVHQRKLQIKYDLVY